MAVYHCHTHPISRSGRAGSAIACAAYRAGAKLEQYAETGAQGAAALAAYRTGGAVADGSGAVHDYSRKGGVAHSEIMLPGGVDAEWAQDRAALWNQAEGAERRTNSRVAREWRIALPHELGEEERIAAAREFAGALVALYGVAADVAVHAPSRSGDQRNWHAHVLCTTRRIANEGFGEKAEIEWSNTNLAKAGKPYSALQIREVRMLWQEIANAHLAEAGQEARVDHRSLADQGIALEAARTVHVGQHYAEARDREIGTERILPVDRLDHEQSGRNAAFIEANPSFIIDKVVARESAFQRRNVASALHRYVNEDWDRFDQTLDRVMADPSLVRLMEAGKTSDAGREVEAVWSTKAVAMREARMLDTDQRLASSGEGAFSDRAIGRGIAAAERGGITLSDEQRGAVETIGREGRVAVLRGVAGTGKTTALLAVREAAEADGRRIVGGALAGKAAGELRDGSGIEARTLASWERSWDAGFDRLGRGDVFVVDEAGMVGSAQMGRLLERVEEAGAKVVLTGDERQLQPIEAGAAFRTIRRRAETRGSFAELSEVRRQNEAWQRHASQLFGGGEAAKALDVYEAAGEVRFENSAEQTRVAIVANYFAKLDEAWERSPDGVRGTDHIVTAYRNVDVDALNALIRTERRARGELGADATFRTDKGERTFAVGDKVLLTRNDRGLGVANGDRAEVVGAGMNRLDVRLRDGREVRVEAEGYDGVQAGYAVTTHKAQGMSVDRVHVMAGDGMHASLAYVAMTRQREGATLYAAREHFRNYDALRSAIGHQRDSSAVGDYLPYANAVEAVRVRIRETDAGREAGSAAGRGAGREGTAQVAADGAHDEERGREARSAMRDAWRAAAERLSDEGREVRRDRERTRDVTVEPVAKDRGQDRASAQDAAQTPREQSRSDGRETLRATHGAERGPEQPASERRDARSQTDEPAAQPSRFARFRALIRGRSQDGHGTAKDRDPQARARARARDDATPVRSRGQDAIPEARPSPAPSQEHVQRPTIEPLARSGAARTPPAHGRDAADERREILKQRLEDHAAGRTPAAVREHRADKGHDRGVQHGHASEPRWSGRETTDERKASLKQRLQDHAAGRTQDPAGSDGRGDQLRQKLVDHAAGRTPDGAAGHGAGRGNGNGRSASEDSTKDRGRERGRDDGAER